MYIWQRPRKSEPFCLKTQDKWGGKQGKLAKQRWAQNGSFLFTYIHIYIYTYIRTYIYIYGNTDTLSKWASFKEIFKDLAGEEGQNKGKQREKEGQGEKTNSHRKLKTQNKKSESLVLQKNATSSDPFGEGVAI